MKHVFLENLGIESEASNNVIAKNEKRDNDEMERARVVMGLSSNNCVISTTYFFSLNVLSILTVKPTSPFIVRVISLEGMWGIHGELS